MGNRAMWNAVERRSKMRRVKGKWRVDEGVDFSCDQKLFPNLLDPNNQQRLFVLIMPAWLPCFNEKNYSHGDKRNICVKLPFLPFAGENRRYEEHMYRYQDRSAILAFGDYFKDTSVHKVQASKPENIRDQLERKTIVESAPYSQAGSTLKVASPARFDSDNESDSYVSDDEGEAFQDAKPAAKRSRRATRNHNAKIS